MHTLLVIGAGRIGTLTAALLKQAKYKIILADAKPSSSSVVKLDITDGGAVRAFFKKNKAVKTIISCLPYFHTLQAAKIAHVYKLNYFDMTEDVEISLAIKKLARNAKTAFVPRCGLAPGLVGIIAHDLAKDFTQLEAINLRVGGLPQYANNILHYALTWSVEGLINQYGNPCYAIEHGKVIALKPLEDREELEIDGMLYEAFNTSGGMGNLIELYDRKTNYLNYKTIRYPGHCEKMKFLMNDLKLNENREVLKNILETALPTTNKDMVIIAVSVRGKKDGRWHEEQFVKKYSPKKIGAKYYSALQVSTAASLCAVVSYIIKHQSKYRGFVFQETLDLKALKKDYFGKYL